MAKEKSGGGQALDMPRATAFKADPSKLTLIGLDTNHKKNEHPEFDKRVLLPYRESLVQSMIRFGWHGAITVAKEGDWTIVIDGRQRVIAAREANRRLEEEGEERRIEVICLTPIKGEDSKKTAVLALMNEHRTTDDMIERARKMENMLRFDATVSDVAAAFGETEATVKNCLKTLECHGDIIKAAERGEVSPSVLVALSALSRDDQMAEFEKMRADGRLTVAEAVRRVHNKRNGHAETNGETSKKLGVQIIRKILKLVDDGELKAELDDAVIATLRVVEGKAKPTAVKGLKAALREVGYFEEE